MFQYGKKSKKCFSQLHSDLQLIFETVLKDRDHTLTEGYRPEERQNEMFDKGLSKLKFPNSKHNTIPSMAVDAWPFVDGDISFDNRQCYYFAGYVLAVADHLYKTGRISHLLRWGGDWDRDNNIKDQSFNDLGHFELIKPN